MKTKLIVIFLLFLNLKSFSEVTQVTTQTLINEVSSGTEKTIDEKINEIFAPFVNITTNIIFYEAQVFGVVLPLVVVWLITAALFFTIYFGFINFNLFRHAISVTKGDYDNVKDPGEVSHFQALTAALSGTVGVGNIAGVALAISVGGPGATFWMIIAGLLGMTLKFAECTLGLKYREEYSDGSVSGGPMFYLKRGLEKQGKKELGQLLAVLFAIFCVGGSFGGGNVVQINQATTQLIFVTGGENSILFGKGYIFGILMAILIGVILIGGIKSIVKVTDKIVPLMFFIYMISCIGVLVINYENIPISIIKIFKGAFSPEATYGGIIGVMVMGFRRASFSNEAGVGSASIAHSTAKTKEPISEGIVALLEPFIDTVVICTMTALVIIVTSSYDNSNANAEGIVLTSRAFASVFSWFPNVLAVCVMLFALSTMISWSYYGLNAWTFLFGRSKTSKNLYNIFFCLNVVVGSSMSLNSVFELGDAMIFAMCFPNIIGLYFLAPELKKDLQVYLEKIKSGAIKRYKN